jgi:hypothetical protein
MSSSAKLGTLLITTREGDEYAFPNVYKDPVVANLSAKATSQESFVVVNVSQSCLTVPFRVIASINWLRAGETEVLWKCAA